MKRMAWFFCLALGFLLVSGCTPAKVAESPSGVNTDQQNNVMTYGPGITSNHDSANPEQLAKQVFESFLQYKEGKSYPETGRIKDYRIESIKIENSKAADFVFSVSYSVLPATDQYCLAGNGKRQRDGWISHLFNFVKVERKGNLLRIVETATSPIPDSASPMGDTSIRSIQYKLTGKVPKGWQVVLSGQYGGKITKSGTSVGRIETVGYHDGLASLPNHSSVIRTENVISGAGQGKLYIIDRSMPAASPTQKTWLQIFAAVPIASRNEALGVWVDTDKASLEGDVTAIKTILQKLALKR
ncbi:hypothetical protein CEB3_c20970 [Peptococcaceae bacterium CEB3]|nr:hypothetical protein CEB3_c20970 [Peptococcaceae bacterium CEB3]